MSFFNNLTRDKNVLCIEKLFSVNKLGKTSNASRNKSLLKLNLPIQQKYSRLLFRKKWLSGRTNSGQISVFSKGPRLKKKLPLLNYFRRSGALSFIAGVNYTGFNFKVSSLVFNSSGEVSYLPFNSGSILFFIFAKTPIITKISPSVFKNVVITRPESFLMYHPYLLIQQQKNVNISFLEAKPLAGIKYTRSFGSRSKIIKLDTRTGLSLVKLSSGVKKIFSAFSLSSEGSANLRILKKMLKNTKSGDWRARGRKPIVRGVAMNPVDHPHGGRTNSIKYPRTPWGKTTKYK